MEEMPSLNTPVQRLKVAFLPLDLPFSGPVTHSGEILNTDKSHGKKPDRFFKNNTILDNLLEYKRNWIQRVNRMPRNRLPRIMKRYSPTGRRNHGRPLKRLLDT
jgi:hypothetical protein